MRLITLVDRWVDDSRTLLRSLSASRTRSMAAADCETYCPSHDEDASGELPGSDTDLRSHRARLRGSIIASPTGREDATDHAAPL